MPHYLIQFSQTPETWAKMIANPEDRREKVRQATEAFGGKLHGYWYSFGGADGFALIEAPDNVTAAAEAVGVAASGAFSAIKTTVLLTVEEMVAALKKAQGVSYSPPGA